MTRLFTNRLGRIDYTWWEWAIMRAGFAWVAMMSAENFLKVVRQRTAIRDPHGIANWVDLEFLMEPAVQQTLSWVWVILLGLYVLNLVPILTVAGLLAIHVLGGTFYMSQGAMHHAHQIVALVWLGHLAALIYAAFRRPHWKTFLFPVQPEVRRWTVFGCQQMIAAAYTITGLTKLVRSEGDWIKETPNLVLQFEKNLRSEYYNKLIPPDDRATQWMVSFMTDWPWLGMAMFTSVLFLELCAFLALYNRALMALWGLALIAMHLSIGAIMKLDFTYHEIALLLFWVNVPGWIGVALTRNRAPQSAGDLPASAQGL